MAAERVRIHTTLCGGSFGSKLRGDYLRQAAIAARAVNRPGKLIWSRNEDIQHDYCRPAAATKIEVGHNAKRMPISGNERLAAPGMRHHLALWRVRAGPSAP